LAIPAHPLALNSARKLDERRQRALSRYYLSAGAGGLAVGVHTTQFAIRNLEVGLFHPVLEIAQEEMERYRQRSFLAPVAIGGICGKTPQALSEASALHALGYDAGLLSLSEWRDAEESEILEHCRRVSEIIPLFGFYLQPAVGGRVLSYAFWREFAEIERVVAIKIAPFNRYQTLEVVRAVVDAGRGDIALYTGNDDTIMLDLLTPYRLQTAQGQVERRIVGGLLGHWAVWTRSACELLAQCRASSLAQEPISQEALRRSVEVTDCNSAFFDSANGFAGCIAGLHEVLRRQGLLEGVWCLDPDEGLSRGQMEEIDRVYRAYPHCNDDAFVEEHRDRWLS
jgi:hypothetical protein